MTPTQKTWNEEVATKNALSKLIPNHPKAIEKVWKRYAVKAERSDFLFEAKGGPYLILDILGKGASGIVYVVLNSQHSPPRLEVIKVLSDAPIALDDHGSWIPKPGSTEAETHSVARFKREVKIGEKLVEDGLSNVVAAHLGSGERTVLLDGEPVIQAFSRQSFDPGTTMRSLRKEIPDASLPLETFCNLAAAASADLALLHGKKVVNRDLKPENILITHKGIKILDMGIAKFRSPKDFQEPSDRTQLTQDKAFMGTPQFASPEQLSDTKNVDTPSDCYSMCCTLFYLLTGRYVFPNKKTIVDNMLAHTTQDPKEALDYLASLGIPGDIIDLFERGLSKNEDDRPTAIEMTECFLRYASFDGKPNTDTFICGVRDGTIRLPMDGSVFKAMQDEQYSFPSGLMPTMKDENGTLDGGVGHFYAGLNGKHSWPEQEKKLATPTTVTGGIRKRVFAAVTAASVLVAGAAALVKSYAKNGQTETEPVAKKRVDPEVQPPEIKIIPEPPTPDPNTTKEDPTVAKSKNSSTSIEPTTVVKPKEITSEEIFRSSKLFQATVKDGKLTKLVFFPGTPSEIAKDHPTTYTRGGTVHIVQCTMTLQELSRYLGVEEDKLPVSAEYRAKNSVPVLLIRNPDTGESIYSPYPNARAFSSDTDAHVFSDLKSDSFRNSFGPNTTQSSGIGFLKHPESFGVLKSLPDDDQFDSLSHDQTQILMSIRNWKRVMEQQQK